MKTIISLLGIILILISCSTEDETEDVVVIGGGLMGSSTAWELSEYGQDVLLIEQQDSIYTFGSSFGEARISRSLGPTGDIFSYLQQTSVSETKNLIDYLNEGEAEILHSMEDIYTTSPVTYMYYRSQLEEVEELLDGQTVEHQYAANIKEAKEKFGMIIPDTMMVVREYQAYSGTLNPSILIKKLHQGIRKHGNRIHYNQKVINLKREGRLFRVDITDTKSGVVNSILSRKVIAAAGPYNGTLVSDIAPYFERLIRPKRLFLSFLRINPDKYDSLTSEQKSKLSKSYPVANLNAEIFYSMIEKYDENERPVFKVGGHFLRTDIKDLDAVWKMDVTEQEILWSMENTVDYLSKLDLPITVSDLEFVRGYSCVYSLTESEVPYVSQVIENATEIDSSFVIVGGMSGIGAKGSLAYGLIAADLILGIQKESVMYQKARRALGSERLVMDIRNLNR